MVLTKKRLNSETIKFQAPFHIIFTLLLHFANQLLLLLDVYSPCGCYLMCTHSVVVTLCVLNLWLLLDVYSPCDCDCYLVCVGRRQPESNGRETADSLQETAPHCLSRQTPSPPIL